MDMMLIILVAHILYWSFHFGRAVLAIKSVKGKVIVG